MRLHPQLSGGLCDAGVKQSMWPTPSAPGTGSGTKPEPMRFKETFAGVSEEQLLQFFVTESEPGSVSSKSLPTGHRQPENEDNVLGGGRVEMEKSRAW